MASASTPFAKPSGCMFQSRAPRPGFSHLRSAPISLSNHSRWSTQSYSQASLRILPSQTGSHPLGAGVRKSCRSWRSGGNSNSFRICVMRSHDIARAAPSPAVLDLVRRSIHACRMTPKSSLCRRQSITVRIGRILCSVIRSGRCKPRNMRMTFGPHSRRSRLAQAEHLVNE